MKLRYFLPIFMAVMAVFVGCQSEEEQIFLSNFKVSTSYVSLSTAGGSTQVTVKATDNWTVDAESLPAWLTVSPMSGSDGESTLTFSADAAQGRTATVKVTCGNKTQEINVIQGIAEVSVATCAEVIAGADAKTYRVTGVVTGIANTVYGNWYLNDGTSDTDVYIYGTLDKSEAMRNA